MQLPAGISSLVEILARRAFEKVGPCDRHLLAPALRFVGCFHKHGNYSVHCFLKHPMADLEQWNSLTYEQHKQIN